MHSGSFSDCETSSVLFSDSTTNAIGSCSYRPGPEGAFKERRAEVSFGAGLESGAKSQDKRPVGLREALKLAQGPLDRCHCMRRGKSLRWNATNETVVVVEGIT